MSDLAKYTFIPWMRQGLASQLEITDHLGDTSNYTPSGDAPKLDLTLLVKGKKVTTNNSSDEKEITLNKQIQLYHPGDIIGIENRAIVKTEPQNGGQDFEANFLPYIEFYEEDFPWRYTPLKANQNQLRPWLALVVLKADEFDREQINPKLPLPSIKIKVDEVPFPPAYQLWAWAHVHFNKTLNTTDAKNSVRQTLEQNPNFACSRLICPRKLEPETEYFAFLIPSFEKGRLAGLGAASKIIEAIDLQLPAWGHEEKFDESALYENRFPFYYEWDFKTGEAGADFETLAKKIVPRELHPNVGKRSVDIQSPGYNLFYEGGDFQQQGTVLMEGALRHVDSDLPDLLDEAKDENHPNKEAQQFTKKLADLINLEEDLKSSNNLAPNHSFTTHPYFEEDGESVYDDPIITPPLYGRWHVNQDRVSPSKNNQWVDELNLDPRYRIAAGLGAEVIRRNQENYMSRAWKQFGELFKLNDFLKKSQLTVEVNNRIFQKHLEPLHPATLISMTSNIHQVVRGNDRRSIKKSLKDAPTPDGIFSSGYGKVTRRGGQLIKRTKTYTSVVNHPGATMEDLKITHPNLETAGEAVFTAALDSELRKILHGAFTALNSSTIPEWKSIALANSGVIGVPLHEPEGYYASDYKVFQEGLAKIAKSIFVDKENYFKPKNWKIGSNASSNSMGGIFSIVKSKLKPKTAFSNKIKSQIKRFHSTVSPVYDESGGHPIVNAPEFKDATYEEIIKISVDEFVPNLDLVPPNTSGLLEINRKFIESFMVGLNYEMARELLWREFPTDQRGTYFKMFWDLADYNTKAKASGKEEKMDIQPIHEWTTDSPLGEHQPEGLAHEQLVLVLRGDLLKRYPNTIIYLQKAIIKNGKRQMSEKSDDRTDPIFEAQINPDVFFLGFDISKEDILEGEGYYFIVQERPGEVHFGLDSEWQASESFDSWDDLNWNHLSGEMNHIDFDKDLLAQPENDQPWNWGNGSGDKASSADMACILYQNPAKIAIHASEMLTPAKDVN